jgi:phospholipid N-methyltransferase
MNTFSYIRNFKTSGTIASSSVKAINRIVENVLPDRPQSIVEMGSGTGAITRQILDKMHPASELHAFEINRDFVRSLRKLRDKRLHVMPYSALNILSCLEMDSVDVIISSLPLSFFKLSNREELLVSSYAALRPGGCFNQLSFLYFPWYFSKTFSVARTEFLMFPFPPAFLYFCKKTMQ